jgi:hypothetical protein
LGERVRKVITICPVKPFETVTVVKDSKNTIDFTWLLGTKINK